MNARTTTQVRKSAGVGIFEILKLVVVLGVVAAIAILVLWKAASQEEATRSEPIKRDAVAPAPASKDRPLKLEAVFPTLSEEQEWGVEMVKWVLDDPVTAVGRWMPSPTKPALDDNQKQFFIALVMRESSLVHFDEVGGTKDSGIDCDGLAQLCKSSTLCPENLRSNPMVNLYCGAHYFAGLLKMYNGDYLMALAHYQGARKMVNGKSVVDPDNPDLQPIYKYIRFR